MEIIGELSKENGKLVKQKLDEAEARSCRTEEEQNYFLRSRIVGQANSTCTGHNKTNTGCGSY